jgi:hypothetical protein
MDNMRKVQISDSDEVFTTTFGPVTYRRVTSNEDFCWIRPDGTMASPVIIPHLERVYSKKGIVEVV